MNDLIYDLVVLAKHRAWVRAKGLIIRAFARKWKLPVHSGSPFIQREPSPIFDYKLCLLEQLENQICFRVERLISNAGA